ncbi:AAA family ATPase [Nocardiopsis sp. NPDC006198]|uniref:ATP-dependent nuclease n=1 Tax=Nocardiopsis sp. NPDC006198 TaxID=3154472 RepID=UPI0033B4FE8A
MYLEQLHIKGFRSVADAKVSLRPGVTVLVGENNAGKTNVMDAIRHLTPPLDGRRDLHLRAEDLHRDGCAEAKHTLKCRSAVELSARYASADVATLAVFDQALDEGAGSLSHHLTYDPPRWGQQRGKVSWCTGDATTADPDPDPVARERIRHLYLPPLRDAQRELASGSGGMIQYLVESQFADESQSRDFQNALQKHFKEMEKVPPLPQSLGSLQKRLSGLTEGARHQQAGLGFADVSIGSVIRSLRLRMEQQGVDVQALASSGLGYANLLFMSVVLAKLDKAAEADLTLLLVEEPEAHLHPQLQSILMQHLVAEAERSREQVAAGTSWLGRVQVVVTTHSPYIATATNPENLVVLQRHGQQVPDTDSAGQEKGSGFEETESSQAEPRRRYFTTGAAVANMSLSPHDRYKIRQYLNATRSTMLFGPRVLLVEGIAEAVLLPELARTHLSRARQQRFLGTALVPIDGTHFTTYLNILLSADTVTRQRIARRVAVVTDGDNGSDRPQKLRMLIDAKAGPQVARVFNNETTLEPALLQAGGHNRALFEEAWSHQRPNGSTADWAEIDTMAGAVQADFLMGKFKSLKISKGTFIQDLVACSAAQKEQKEKLVAPTYLHEALTWITEEDHDVR